jgi:hypothetical protein
VLTHNAGNQATGGIWKVRRDDRPAVLKLATPNRTGGAAHWPAGDEPGHWNYWKRESLAYGSGLASSAYPGIGTPDLLEVTDRPDGSVALWLAEVPGVPGMRWAPDRFREFAWALGAGHGRWLSEPMPEPWLARDWLRDYTTSRPVPDEVPWDLPVAAEIWPDELRTGLRDLYDRRFELIDRTDELPVTLCHHDVWPMNLIGTDAGPVLLDWSFVGPGPIGEDAANLILDTFFDGLTDVSALPEVTAAVLDGYLAGLAGAVDPDTVRAAVALTGAVKYFWLAPGMLAFAAKGAAGAGNYDDRRMAERMRQCRPLFELITSWLRTGTAY